MFSSCIDCEGRFVEFDEDTGLARTCHSECPDYIEASILHQKQKDIINKIKSDERAYIDIKNQSYRRCGGVVSEV